MPQPTHPDAFRKGSSGARADKAARATETLLRPGDLRALQERLLDEGLEETFPASDPVAVSKLT